MERSHQDFTGMKFNKLTVIGFSHKAGPGKFYWHTVCECGNSAVRNGIWMKIGKVKSCGCLKKVSPARTHGMKNTPEYKSWSGLKSRCLQPRNKKYPSYGGRGIKVCERWLNSFENFYADMGPKPSKVHSVGRIDNDGHYEPTNCRWETPKQQSNNRRRPQRSQAGHESNVAAIHAYWDARAKEATYIYRWGARFRVPGLPVLDRKGEECRVLARGAMNSAMIEFLSDGERHIVSRNALRKKAA